MAPNRVASPARPTSPRGAAPPRARRRPHRAARRRPAHPAAPHRTGLTVLVGITAGVVITGLVAGSAVLEQLMSHLPVIPSGRIGVLFAVATALAFGVWGLVRLARAARTRARRIALETTVRGELSCGIRTSTLAQRLNELAHEHDDVHLSSRYSIVVDEGGVTFWNGGARPRRVLQFPWRQVRSIRADSMVVGGSVVPAVVLRVRQGGASVELPIILTAGRPGRFALSDAPFFATVRSWKAKHRDALAAEGLEPPHTAPVPVMVEGTRTARHHRGGASFDGG